MQFSLFGAEAVAPTLEDLDGILLAGGHWARTGEDARLSVVVADAWRAEALAEAFAARAIEDAEPIADGPVGLSVRTTFDARLIVHAARWTRGAREAPPPGLMLTPGGLRLWAIASGIRNDAGYLLGTAEPDDPVHTAAGAQLSRLGVAAVSIASRQQPGWRVTSAKRLRRLAELLGPPPPGGDPDWPLAML